MINVKDIMLEERSETVEYGCLMALVPDDVCAKIVEFNKKIVPEKDLYKQGDEFGREEECHITIKYGFTPELNELDVRRILKDVKPFEVTLKKLSQFQTNPNFDVVKFEVESPKLVELNERTKAYKTVDLYPTYNPHLTLAYVKKDSFPFEQADTNITFTIDTVYYSTVEGTKTYYDLNND